VDQQSEVITQRTAAQEMKDRQITILTYKYDKLTTESAETMKPAVKVDCEIFALIIEYSTLFLLSNCI
jgi:hypothetical protein